MYSLSYFTSGCNGDAGGEVLPLPPPWGWSHGFMRHHELQDAYLSLYFYQPYHSFHIMQHVRNVPNVATELDETLTNQPERSFRVQHY